MKPRILLLFVVSLCTICGLWHVLAADYYSSLGLNRGATESEIKRAFYRLSLEYHPDKNVGAGDQYLQMYMEIVAAYETLSDPAKKSRYDSSTNHDAANGGGSNGQMNPGRHQFVQWPVDVKYIYTGGTLTVNLNKPMPCPQCHGTGRSQHIALAAFSSPPSGSELPEGHTQHLTQRGDDNREFCARCKGDGYVMGQGAYMVQFEAGVPDGTRFTIRGAGEQLKRGQKPGDVTLVLFAKTDGQFRRVNETDLLLVVKVTEAEIRAGLNRYIPHLDGKTLLTLKTPPLSSRYDPWADDEQEEANRKVFGEEVNGVPTLQPLVMEGKGMPRYKQRSIFGDLFIEFQTLETAKELSPPLRCPNDCSGKGRCNMLNRQCECESGYYGGDCSISETEYRFFGQLFTRSLSEAKEVRQWANGWHSFVSSL